jgi:hypothetical protein
MSNRTRIWTLSSIVAALVVAGGVWGFVALLPNKPEAPAKPITKEELKANLSADALKALSAEERKKKMAELGNRIAVSDREEMRGMRRDEEYRKIRENLSEEERRELRRNSRGGRREEYRKRIKEFFAKTPEEQNKQLDETLDRMQEWRKRREERRAEREAAGENTERRERRERRPRTDEDRTNRMKRTLERTEPEDRAQFQEYFRRLNERAEEREIEMPMWGGRGRR